jgi:hypothetical protein
MKTAADRHCASIAEVVEKVRQEADLRKDDDDDGYTLALCCSNDAIVVMR